VSEHEREEESTERAIHAAVDLLEQDVARGRGSEEIRPWIELLGLLPAELEPVKPSPGVKEALMQEVGRRASGSNVESLVTTSRDDAPAGTPLHWVFKVAAMLAVVLLGLSIKQAGDLADREAQLELQASRIAEVEAALAGLAPTAGLPDWMTASGTELCALRPQRAGDTSSKGWLFVRSDHQHWYVAVEGLAPCPEGHVYELWFIADGKPVSGGRFEPDADGRVTLTSETMPTGITGIAITLEPIDGDGTPSEETVLYGHEVMLTL
jgi:hypothetical protein